LNALEKPLDVSPRGNVFKAKGDKLAVHRAACEDAMLAEHVEVVGVLLDGIACISTPRLENASGLGGVHRGMVSAPLNACQSRLGKAKLVVKITTQIRVVSASYPFAKLFFSKAIPEPRPEQAR
jgi:hypothetical protein